MKANLIRIVGKIYHWQCRLKNVKLQIKKYLLPKAKEVKDGFGNLCIADCIRFGYLLMRFLRAF